MARKTGEEREPKSETLEELGLRYLAAQEQRLRVCRRENDLRDELKEAMQAAGRDVLVVGPRAIVLHVGCYSTKPDLFVKDL